MQRNIERIRGRLAGTGVGYRAHLKTAKSVEVARRQMLSPAGPAMVSTLREAEVFAEAGVTDMTYGVGIAADKLGRVLALRRRGVDLTVILDSVAQAEAVAAASTPDLPLAALIEIDCDGHRSGVKPDDAALLGAIAAALEPAAELRGVLTHGGESYGARGTGGARGGGRAGAAGGGRRPRRSCAAAGHACPVVSVGSTPTFMSATLVRGADRVPRRGLRVLRPVPGRGRGVRTRRYRAVGAGDGDRPPAGEGLDHHRRRLDGDVARPRHGDARRSTRATAWSATSRGAPLGDLIVSAPTRSTASSRRGRAAAAAAPALPLGTRAAGAAEPRLRHGGAVRPLSRGPRRRRRGGVGAVRGLVKHACRNVRRRVKALILL